MCLFGLVGGFLLTSVFIVVVTTSPRGPRLNNFVSEKVTYEGNKETNPRRPYIGTLLHEKQRTLRLSLQRLFILFIDSKEKFFNDALIKRKNVFFLIVLLRVDIKPV